MSTRIERRFAELTVAKRGGLVVFVTAGDPTYEVSRDIILSLPNAGADVIELGMPFSAPMADGPSIEAAGLRALANGASMKMTLKLVRDFRKQDDQIRSFILSGNLDAASRISTTSAARSVPTSLIDGCRVPSM